MKFIYMDNFRGFRNTCVPISDVNFLVGENSTGKSSFLALVNLFSSHSFWFSLEFNTDYFSFGDFFDIVSVSAKEKTKFLIGLFNKVDPPSGSESQNPDSRWQVNEACLMEFVEKTGLPRLTRYSHLTNGIEYHLRFSGNKVKWRADELASFELTQSSVSALFERWRNVQAQDSRGYLQLSSEIRIDRVMALVEATSLVEHARKHTKPEKAPISVNVPAFTQDLAWLAPIRSRPRRTYDQPQLRFSPEGEHIPYFIRRLLSLRKTDTPFKKYIERVGRESGLFETISLKKHGQKSVSPFELDVVLGGKPISIVYVGYGVSQSLPVIVEMFLRRRNSWIAVQQPEVHLHPRAQAALGDVVFDMANSEKKKFLIETHSDFTIDRFRIRYRQKEGDKIGAQILFFSRRDSGNSIEPIVIEANGELPETQPSGFRDFFVRESLKIIGA